MVDSINNPFRQMKGYCQIDGGETFYGGGSVAENSKLSDVEKLKNKSVWTLEDRKQAERCLNEIDFSTRASDNDTEEAKAALLLQKKSVSEADKLVHQMALKAIADGVITIEPASVQPEERQESKTDEPKPEVKKSAKEVKKSVNKPVQSNIYKGCLNNNGGGGNGGGDNIEVSKSAYVVKTKSGKKKINPKSGQFRTVVKNEQSGRYKSFPAPGFHPKSEDSSFSTTISELNKKVEDNNAKVDSWSEKALRWVDKTYFKWFGS